MNNLEYTPDYRYYYIFNEHYCPLLPYLRRKIPIIKPEQRMFALIDILMFLRHIANRESLFDEKNLDVILCDSCLEQALDVKALHIRQVAEYVKKQLLPTRLLINYQIFPAYIKNGLLTANTRQNFIDVPILDTNAFYFVKDSLGKLLFPSNNSPNTKHHFKDICRALSNYIITNRTKLFDERNLSVALIGQDALSNAFGGIKAFHRCQVHGILKMHLYPSIIPDSTTVRQPISIVINLPSFASSTNMDNPSASVSVINNNKRTVDPVQQNENAAPTITTTTTTNSNEQNSVKRIKQ